MARDPIVELGGGQRYRLVEAHRMQRWDLDTARAQLRAAAQDDPGVLAELVRFAADLRGEVVDGEAAIEWIARAIAAGELVPWVQEQEQPSGMRPVLPGVEPIDWADIRPLSELREDPESEPGWLSIELVDHAGVPLADVVVTLVHRDGRRDRVVLDPVGRFVTHTVPAPGPTRIEWPAKIERGTQRPALALEGFRAAPDDVAVPRRPASPTILPQLDRHYRLVLEPPPRQPTVSFGSALFATESALPTGAIHDLVTRAHESIASDKSLRLGVFGHTDVRDDPAANKDLADRRAQAVFAILTNDWPSFEAALATEQWSLDRWQAMLRVLGCNPTAIDAQSGAQTNLAVRAFRRAYNRDTWHDEGRPRAYGDLPDGDALDDATGRAIVDAYHAELSGRLDPALFVGPKFAGCGEFNPLGKAHHDDRRTTLAIYGADTPEPAEFPCRAGDAGACQVAPGDGSFTCKFYRERIHEAPTEHQFAPFWSFEWLRTLSGKAHLSALTYLPDSNDVAFTVRVVEGGGQPMDDCGKGPPPSHGEIVATLPGLIRNGVAYALWDHGPGYDPFDQRQWFRLPSEAKDARPWLAPYLPPVFVVASQGYWGVSEGPGVVLPRMRTQGEDGAMRLVVGAGGRIALVRSADAQATAREVRVTTMLVPGARVRIEGEDGDG